MPANQFQLRSFLETPNEVFHVARTTINSRESLQLHSHGYAELFWIKSGEGMHLINGEEVPLCKGMLCMIRPTDSHTFKLRKHHHSLVVTNIAFFRNSLDYFRTRYFPDSNSYFWSIAKLPYTIQLNADHLNELTAITDRLLGQSRDFLHLDFLMINIFRMISSIEEEQAHIPSWLAFALNNYNTPEHFRDGAQGFVDLSNRSVDHVNRVLKRFLKQTLTETVINARLQYACQQLIMTNSSIKSICYDCGFDSVSYFYRLFKKQTGQTPLQYRKKNHKIF